jgi:DNA-binding transcriptional LysR family regulator
MGTQLAARTPSGLELTNAGEAIATAAIEIREVIEQVARRVGDEDHRAEGLVRLSSPPGFGPLLLRGLSRLRDEHPGIQVEVLPAPGAIDLLRREADLAIRMFRETTASLIMRKVGEVGWSLYASEDYLVSRDVELGTASLAGHDVIDYEAGRAKMPGGRWLGEHLGDKAPVMTCGDPSSALAAVSAGIGVGVLPCFITQGHPRLRRLVADVLATGEVFLVIPPDHKNTTRVRLTADFLADYFTEHADVLAGRMAPRDVAERATKQQGR